METDEVKHVMIDIRDFNLLEHNTFGMNVKCSRFVEFSTIDDLRSVICELHDKNSSMLVIGGGSNLLFMRDYDGVIIHSAIKGITCSPCADGMHIDVSCGSGEKWDDVVALCVEKGWYGLENLSYIPGEVGASAVQNIGAYGVEVKDYISSVEAIEVATGRIVTFENEECEYGYRKSRFKHDWKDRYIITRVTYRLNTEFNPNLDYGRIRQTLLDKGIIGPTAQQVRDVVIEIRRSKLPDPKELGNAGSFFMNPVVSLDCCKNILDSYPDMPYYKLDDTSVKIPAGWLIEKCGWKGTSIGRAAVHDKQSLVLVNLGGATGDEILNLCNLVCKDVYDKFGITIRPEVNIIGLKELS